MKYKYILYLVLPVRNTHLTKGNLHIQSRFTKIIQEMAAHKYLQLKKSRHRNLVWLLMCKYNAALASFGF